MRAILPLLLLTAGLAACSSPTPSDHADQSTPVETASFAPTDPAQIRNYWYAGDAEIASYTLTQARYGELRQGDAVIVFVTEPFSKSKQVKLDYGGGEDEVQVLKMNQTRSFNTGIYPYSMMTSTFSPMDGGPALKATTSSQEWCGHTWTQMNLEEGHRYRFEQRSYFESEGDQNATLTSGMLEDDLWSEVRLLHPDQLPPEVEVNLIPSLQFLRLRHLPVQPYKATITTKYGRAGESMLLVEYKDIERSLALFFTTEFPHTIERWEETYRSGVGPSAEVMTTTGVLNKRIKAPYWNLNRNADAHYRTELGLD
ncbi:MAG: septum formation inhibitor Maf [Flavobacteriales bacterium]